MLGDESAVLAGVRVLLGTEKEHVLEKVREPRAFVRIVGAADVDAERRRRLVGVGIGDDQSLEPVGERERAVFPGVGGAALDLDVVRRRGTREEQNESRHQRGNFANSRSNRHRHLRGRSRGSVIFPRQAAREGNQHAEAPGRVAWTSRMGLPPASYGSAIRLPVRSRLGEWTVRIDRRGHRSRTAAVASIYQLSVLVVERVRSRECARRFRRSPAPCPRDTWETRERRRRYGSRHPRYRCELRARELRRASPSSTALNTMRCCATRGLPAKASDTTTTLKWVSEPAGTLCCPLSFTTSRCTGDSAPASLWRRRCSTTITEFPAVASACRKHTRLAAPSGTSPRSRPNRERGVGDGRRPPHSDRRRSFAFAQSAASAPPASTASDSASRAARRLGATKRTPTSSARSLAARR